MLHIAYITLYFLQSVTMGLTLQTPESEENPYLKYTLFPENGPVFMRRMYTEPTVVFNGTLSLPVWKYIDITITSTSTQASAVDLFPPSNLIKSNQNAVMPPEHFEPIIAPSSDLNAGFRTNKNDQTFPSTISSVDLNENNISSNSNVDNTSNPLDLIPSNASIMLSPNPANSVNPSTLGLITKIQNIVNPFNSNVSISSTSPVSIPSTVTNLPTIAHSDYTEKESNITDLIHPEITVTSERPTSSKTHVPEIPLMTTTSSFIYPEITASSTYITEASEIYDHISDATPVYYDFTEINPKKLLRMQTSGTTEQTVEIKIYTNEIKEPTEQNPTWLESINQPADQHQYTPHTKNVVSNEKEMDDGGMETVPFSTFFRKLLKVLSTKHEFYLLKLIKPFENYVASLMDSGKLMKLGASTSVWIVQAAQLLLGPIKELQRQIFVGQIYLENRRKMLSNDVNTILDDMDDVYDVNEEEAMQRVLNEVSAFPNTTKTGEMIARDFIHDVFIWPMNRIAGTARGKILFKTFGKIASKYSARRYEVNDENKLIDQVPEHADLNKEYPKEIHEDNKFIDPSLVSEVLLKRDGRYINKKKKHLRPISVHKDLPDNIKIYSSKILKEKQFDDSSKSEDNAESSSSDGDGLEIRIKIRNGKYSVKEIRRNLTNAGEFNKK